jgi:hypothetical protein
LLYKEELDANRSSSSITKRTSRSFLSNLIKTKWNEYGLFNYSDTEVPVSCGTIRSRLRCKSLIISHRGTAAPLKGVEEVIVDTIIQMGRIRQPMSVIEIIDFTNSLIDGSEFQEKLVLLKKNITQTYLKIVMEQ